MSPSEESEEECIPVSKTRKKKVKRMTSSGSEDKSDSDSLTRSQKLDCNESSGQTTPKSKINDIVKTPATRSSERLRNKKEFRLPSRDEVLGEASPEMVKSSTKKLRELKPRRAVNNFIRERNSYATDKYGDIYLTDDSFSDFIDDGDEVEEEDSESEDVSSGKKVSKKSKPTRKRRKQFSSSESNSDYEGSDAEKRKTKSNKKEVKRKTKKKQKTILTSSESEQSELEDYRKKTQLLCLDNKQNSRNKEISKTNDSRTTTRRKIIQSSGSESDSSIDKPQNSNCHVDKSKTQTVRRSSRRRKLLEKEEIKNRKYEQLIESRKKLSKGTNLKKEEEIKIDGTQDKEILQSLIDNFSTDESDENFVVSDEEISEEEEAVSDFEVTFLKLRDSQSPDPQSTEGALDSSPSKTPIRMRRKQRNQTSKWKRINTKVESNDSTDSGSNANDDYDHGCHLHVAVKNNDVELVKQILQNEPSSVHDLGYRKRTALHLAALNGNAELVQLLLKSKANCKLQDKYGFSPIAYAANGHSECLKILLKYIDMKKVHKTLIETDSKMSLLHLAIGESRTCEDYEERGKCMQLLFAHDMEACTEMLYHKDARGRTPLEAAVFASQHKCLEVLLKNGANLLFFKTEMDGNILHFAVECASHLKRVSTDGKDSALCLKVLIESMKNNLDDKDMHDFTPLMYACESGNYECLCALIEAGATVVTKDGYGTSPLHLAAMAGSTECVQLLLSCGHPVDCVDKCGWPPLLYADFSAQEECVLALMKPKPRQLFVLGKLLKSQKSVEDQKKIFKVVKNVLMSLANHDAYYTVFNDFIRANPVLLDEYNHGVLQHSWRAILDFNNKLAWFKRKLEALPGTSCWSSDCRLMVKREDILGSTMQQIGHIPAHKFRASFSITFANEPGICTGPKREFFACLCKDVVNSKRGLFTETDDCQYSPIPNEYFSSLVPEVYSKPDPAFHKRTEEAPKTEEVPKTEQDSSETPVEDFTDSELLSIDIEELTSNNEGESTSELNSSSLEQPSTSAEQPSSCTGPLLSSAEPLSSPAEQLPTSSGNQHSSSEEQPSSGVSQVSTLDEQSSSEDTLVGTELSAETANENSQKEVGNKWISCKGNQQVVIRNVVLRSKMKQLHLIGRLVGSAICQNMLLNLHLSKPFIKQLLGIPLSHPGDLASFDHQLHESMVVWVQENSVDDLDLPFSLNAINPWTGELVTVNLSDDEDKTLNDLNKDEYVQLVSQFKLEKFIEKEVKAFKDGLNEVIPRDLLTFFTPDEFSLLMNGVTKIDVEDWKQNTTCSGFEQFPFIIEWFWDIVSKLKEDEKALLLQFSTGSPCVPTGGFANLGGLTSRFKISKHHGMNKIPHAQTCFNLLQLSDYDSEKQLREKLLIAIRHGSEGFSFS